MRLVDNKFLLDIVAVAKDGRNYIRHTGVHPPRYVSNTALPHDRRLLHLIVLVKEVTGSRVVTHISGYMQNNLYLFLSSCLDLPLFVSSLGNIEYDMFDEPKAHIIHPAWYRDNLTIVLFIQ